MIDIRRVYNRYRAPLLGVSLFLCFFTYIVYANYFDTFFEEQTIHILPLSIDGTGWQNIDTLYVQDLSESALFEDFTTRNSASVDFDAPQGQLLPDESAPLSPEGTSSENTSPSEGGGSNEETVPGEGGEESAPATPPEATTDVPTDASVDEPSVSESEESQSEQSNSTESGEAPSVDEPVSTGVGGFIARVRERFFLAQETVVSEVDTENSEATSPVAPEDSSTVSPSPAPAVDAEGESSSQNLPTEPGESTPPSETEVIPDTLTETTTDTDTSVSSTTPEGAGSTTPPTPPESEPEGPALIWNGFSLPYLAETETIENAQVRMSFGAQARPEAGQDGVLPQLRMQYSFANEPWVDAGSVVIDDEVSNALNGGFYLFALPPVLDPQELRTLRVRAVYDGTEDEIEALFIDSLWVEINAMTLNREALDARVAPDALTDLEKPAMHELISEEIDFTREELPHFALRYEEQRNIAVQLARSVFSSKTATVEDISIIHRDVGELPITPLITETNDGIWSIQIPEAEQDELRPGEYTIELTIDEGGVTFTDRFEFQWGLLAINTNETEYVPGEGVDISLGALSPNGNTLCEATLELYLIDEGNFIRRLPVERSGLCNGNNVVSVPDYHALYSAAATGTYELYVERIEPETGRALAHARTTFAVVPEAPVSIVRSGPTRIYPVEPYRMDITVIASTSLRGTFTEIVPADFVIDDTAGRVEVVGDEQRITFDVAVAKGEQVTLSYRFDSPDISPYLYELGPATLLYEERGSVETDVGSSTEALGDVGDAVVFTESKTWQIASDATGSMIIYSSDGTTVPAGWTCLSCGSGTVYQRFIRGGATYNSTGGSATMTHTASAIVNQSSAQNSENRAGTAVAVVSHGHSLTPSITSTSSLPAYRQLRALQYNSAGEPPTIPSGAVLPFDGTPPAGWTAISALNDRYVYGENTTTATGGSNTHRHTVSGTTGAASGGTVDNRTGSTGATAAHTHTISSSTPLTSHEPSYITVIYASTTGATTTPVGALAFWTDTPPAGWLNRSGTVSDPFYDRFIKGAASYGTTGGADTHTHADMNGITSSAPSATVQARVTGTITGASPTHTHQVDVTSFSTDSNLPPYVTAIVARKYGAVPIYTQSAFRWYANTNAQTPTDPWPVGGTNLNENEPITATSTVVGYDTQIRLRMALNVSNSTSTADAFKLQYASTTSGTACSLLSNWADVGVSTSSTVWRAYDNASVSDGSTLSSTTLTGIERLETYEESNPTATIPNQIGIGEDAEWDFSLLQNGAEAGVDYCFRMVEDDGTPLFTYTLYPRLTTNEKTDTITLVKPFDNEKVATTTPLFRFFGSDPETNSHTYQIQIDDDYSFASALIDNDSEVNSTRFVNIATPADKDPFNNAETVQFQSTTALSNGTTYYWRVRSRDNGSNTWGDWSSPRSITVDTSLTVSTWHQTTEEQFETDTLVGVEATASDQVSLISGSTTGTTTSSEIRFEWADLGNAWGSLSWNDNETAGDIKYRLQYEVTDDTWANIPDSVLSGNAAGFDTSPVNLLGVNPDTYSTIRIVGVFTNSGGSPSLQDWTLSWGYRIDTPTISKLFSNEKTGTTTPTFQFTTTDPQSDALQYQIQWSTSYLFTSSTTRTSGTDNGFLDLTDILDTSPFDSGDTIQFTVQPADALTNNTTYWWRVRAVDPPPGSNTYSEWTEPRSFTVDTTVTLSTWFQTTTEQFATDILSGATSTGNLATVATTAVESLIVYAEGTTQEPLYRLWDGSAWSDEESALSVGARINWVVTKASETREEYITATVDTNQDVNVQIFQDGAWGDLQEVTTSLSDPNYRGVDIAYENTSGDALVATCDGDPDPTYWIWNGSTWANGGTVNLSSTANCGWIKLISDPVSDEIILVSLDVSGTQYEAQVWNGSAWGNAAVWGSMAEIGHEGIAAAYEESGNQAVVAVSNGTGGGPARSFTWRAWNGATWTAAASEGLGDEFEYGSMVADVGSDNMAICYVDGDGDIGAVRWTGAAWAGQTELETAWLATDNIDNDRPVDCIFETGGARDGYIMVAYTDTTNVRHRAWNGAAWDVGETDVSTIQDSRTVQLRRTGAGRIQLVAFDTTNNRYDYSYWNGTSWSTFQTLETDGSVDASPYKEPYMIAPRNPGTSASVIGDPGIDWNDGSGPYWQELSWNDTESGGSSILYQIEYYDGDSWELVPNVLIPGNSTGTSTSPITLTNVLPVASTYNIIRPVANLTCNLGTCPTLADWTLTWAAGINISGTAQQYNQSTNLTSGTVAVALNGVLQTGKTGAISGGTWSIANVNAAPGDIITVFIDGAADSGEAVAVTEYDGVGDVTGMNLFERHLSIGSNDNTTVSNSEMLYDNTNDEDVFFDISGSALTLCAVGESACGDSELIIKSGNTYQPNGNTTLHDIEINGTFAPGGNTIRLNGSWDNNATSTAATSTIIFTATTTSETISLTGALVSSFNNVTFGEGSGTATWTLQNALDVDGNLSVAFGTLARGGNDISVAGNLTNGANGLWTGVGTTTFDGTLGATWSDSASTKQDIGYVVIDGTTKTVTLASSVRARTVTIGANDTLDAGTPTSYDITVLSHWTNTNVFVPRGGTVTFTATTTGRVITTGISSFNNLAFNGAGGEWSFGGTSLSVGNDFTIATGTVTLPTATTTVAGSFINSGGAFAHNNGELRFTSTGPETITFGATQFTNSTRDIVFNGSGGTWTITDTNATTTRNVTILAGTPTLPSGTYAVGGSWTTTGAFAHNGGTVRFYSSGTETIGANASNFSSLRFGGSGSFTLSNTNLTAVNDVTVDAGTVTLPTGIFTIGGSLTNAGTLIHSSGTVLFSATTPGETVSLGTSPLHNITFQGGSLGAWTVSGNATSTNTFTITSGTLSVGSTLSVGGTFQNPLGGASTTWTGSTLRLYGGGTYQINASTTVGDTYATLLVASSTKVSMWNSSAGTHTVDATGYLYSQNHANQNGDLYIFGAYTRSSGTEYWSATRDFDGTLLGTPRQVDVRFASGASATFSSSTLTVLGTSTATTTIAASSGTYTVSLERGTTTLQYFEFQNLGTTGVTLGTSTSVTQFSDGRFVPGIASGSGLRVASSTVDQNPGLQIQRIDFSTTTAISATNVTQFGGTPTSYWWFRNSTGNLDGEAYDSDTGDPGSIRWDDSSYVITISGTVYADAGITALGAPTCDGVATSVRVVVNSGSSTHDGTCAPGTGVYSIPNVTYAGDPVITVYLNTNGGARGAVVTKTPTADITGLDIYQNRVITRHENVTPLSIADMALFDEDNDTDIRFSATTTGSSTLTVRGETELFVFASTTFTPNGNVTLQSGGSGQSYDATFHVDNNATATAQGTEQWSVGGRFQVDAGGTFIPASSTVTMTATSTGKTISSPGTINFNTLTFSGSGAWDIVANLSLAGNMNVNSGTVTGSGNIGLTYGSLTGVGALTLTGGTTTLERTNVLGGTTPWQFYNLTLGSGSVAGTTTRADVATTTVLNRLTISTAHTLDAGGSRWDIRGTSSPFTISGTFSEGTSRIRYGASSTATVASDTYYDLEVNAEGGPGTFSTGATGIAILNTLSVGGTASTTFTLDAGDPTVSVSGSVLVKGNGTFIGSASSLLSVGGSWDNDGTFVGSGGTVLLNGSGAVGIAAGNSAFSNLTLSGSGTFTVSENATTTGNFTLTSVGSFIASGSVRIAVGGEFSNDVAGGLTNWNTATLHLYSGTSYEINPKTTSDTYATLSIAPNTDIRMWGSSAGSYSIDSTGSLYSMDHAGVDGEVYIYSDYARPSGTDYWAYAYDFDGTALGGSSRAVTVRFASGARAYYTGGGLFIFGDGAATTTITNQGSGTYDVIVGGTASTTMRYYAYRNLASSGVTFTGTPNVVSLSNGDIEVVTVGGSGMTVGGTAINQNPAKTFTANRFATTSAIAAFNVTATGTAVSSWRFTNHTGNIAGEAYDNDPDGNPGYIVWDDSAASITIAGNVYSDEGTTSSAVCDGVTQNVKLVVEGVTTYTTTCTAGTGAYSIGGVSYSTNSEIIVFIDGETEKGATVTVGPVSSIANMHIYENRVIVRHENTNPITIADLAVYDSTDDADVPFTAVDAGTDTLTLPANRKLIVWTSKEFAPGGNVTLSGGGGGAAYDGTLELFTNALFTAAGTESHAIGGSLVTGTGATFTAAQSTFTFTTTGASRTIDTNAQQFYNVTLNGSGSWSVTDSTMSIGNNFTITAGSVTLSSGTTTVAGSFANNGGTFAHNGGTLELSSTSGGRTLRAGGSSWNRVVFTGSGGAWSMTDTNATATLSFLVNEGTVTLPSGVLAVGSRFFTQNGTLVHNSGTLRLTATTSELFRTNGSDLNSVVFAPSGSYTMSDASLALAGSLTISSGSVTFATGTLSIAGSLTATGGTFAHASGTVLFNSSDTGETVSPGTSSFYNVSFGSASGGWTMTSNATATNNFSLTSATSYRQASSTTLSVGGVFTNAVGGTATNWDGSTLRLVSGTTYVINTKSTGADRYNILTIASSTALSMWNSSATSTSVDSGSSLYSMDHGAVDGELYIYGNYQKTAGTDYWSFATDFDGVALGGGSRAVTVRHAENATTTITGGALSIVGGASATTTITNQGSGTYSVRALGGTFGAQYYALRNLGASGLELRGTTTISTLSNGDFELAVSGGSLITVSSTTVNANTTAVYSSVRFATTTAITGANVTLLGTTPSSWTFSAHTGNLSGESYDVETGDTGCESIRWDNSSCLLLTQAGYRWRADDGGEGAPNSEWYNVSWTKRKRVAIQNTDATPYTNAVVKVTVPYDGDMQTNFADLRFTASDGTTPLSYFRETYTASTEAVVWVEVPTLGASEDVSVFMYYGNGLASDASSGTTTFAAFDDFEDGSLSEYTGDTSYFTAGTSFNYERTRGLDAAGNENSETPSGMYRTDLNIAQGQTFRYFQYVDTSINGNTDETCTQFGVQSAGSNYAVCFNLVGTDRVIIAEDVTSDADSGTILASTTLSFTTGWYEVEVDWGTNNSITAVVRKDGAGVATTTTTDSTYTSGDIGFSYWFQHGGWDIPSVRTLLTTEPTVRLGAEQSPNGASWIAAQNTFTSSLTASTTARLRFLIENTGLTVSNKQFELEYAAKGASPSCEAVDSADYDPVPLAASCGSSPVCMTTSSNVTNQASTTDQLGGAGTFTFGQSVEDPSNDTGALTIPQYYFTETEYAVLVTSNATAGAYCLRVTDNGTPLDSYERVAELRLRYSPTITNVTVNGGALISLLPGTTTAVTATGTVSDLNGYGDITAATGTLYRSLVSGAGACAADNNNCYRMGTSSCSLLSCSGNSCTLSCTANVYYFAEPTDAGVYEPENWRAFLSAVDTAGDYGTGVSSIGQELGTLRALDVVQTIDYGSLESQSNTGSYNATTTINNIGNDAIDVSIAGTNLVNGGSIIPVSSQKFATTTFTYSSCTLCSLLATSTTNLEVDLSKPTAPTPVGDDVFWGISIPFGIAASPHQGVNTFYAIGD